MTFTWNPSRQLGAALVADDTMTDVEIAKRVGVTRKTLTNWKHAPEFLIRVQELRKTMERKALELALQYGIADTRERVRGLNERRELMRQVIRERSRDPIMQKIAGGKTGLLVHQLKARGLAGHLVDEYEVDTGLLHELREHERQAAVELGQWVEKHSGVGEYEGEYSDWTDEEIEKQLELNRQRRDRQRGGTATKPADVETASGTA